MNEYIDNAIKNWSEQQWIENNVRRALNEQRHSREYDEFRHATPAAETDLARQTGTYCGSCGHDFGCEHGIPVHPLKMPARFYVSANAEVTRILAEKEEQRRVEEVARQPLKFGRYRISLRDRDGDERSYEIGCFIADEARYNAELCYPGCEILLIARVEPAASTK